jgi:hypothetical protein
MIPKLLAVCLLGAVFMAGATPARADRDAVQFFSDIRVAPDTTVHDAVCFFCSVKAEGEVRGDIVVFFGNVYLAGRADHDVVNFFGKVTAVDNAQIDNNLVSFFGMIRLGEDVSIGRDMVAMFGAVRAPESVTVGHDRVAMPFLIFLGPMVLLGLMITVIVQAIRAGRRRRFLEGYGVPPWP